MTLTLCNEGESKHKYGGILDISIAFFFCFSYFSLARTTSTASDLNTFNSYYLYTLIFISIAQLMILLYEIPKENEPTLGIIEYSPLTTSLVGMIALCFSHPKYSLGILLITLLVSLSLYMCKVWQSSHKKVKV